MATRNQTALFRKYREALRSVRPYVATSSGAHGGAIELVEAPLLKRGGPRGYNAIGGEDLDAGQPRCGLFRSLASLRSSLQLVPVVQPYYRCTSHGVESHRFASQGSKWWREQWGIGGEIRSSVRVFSVCMSARATFSLVSHQTLLMSIKSLGISSTEKDRRVMELMSLGCRGATVEAL